MATIAVQPLAPEDPLAHPANALKGIRSARTVHKFRVCWAVHCPVPLRAPQGPGMFSVQLRTSEVRDVRPHGAALVK
eukprot:gene14642-biopygen3186